MSKLYQIIKIISIVVALVALVYEGFCRDQMGSNENLGLYLISGALVLYIVARLLEYQANRD